MTTKFISQSALCLLLALCMTGCTAGAEQHTGEAEGYGGTIKVTVTRTGEDITSVKVTEHHETQGVGSRAIDALPALIAEADSIDVDGVSGATVTSNAIKEAVAKAIGLNGAQETASAAQDASVRMGMGVATTGRVGPGQDAEGGQVYSVNVVMACGEFDEDGVIRSMRIDQLELVSPNLGGGNTFSGFPAAAEDEANFLSEVSAWQTKGAMGEEYKLPSGTWREQMDEYERQMVGKTVDEVKTWYANQRNPAETQTTDAADGGTAQPVNDMADVPAAGTENANTADGQTGAADATTGATISLDGEYGDVLLAIQRAWENAANN